MKSTERIRRLVRLTGRERRQLVRAWCSLVLVGAALRVVPVTRLLPRRAACRRPPSLSPERLAWLLAVARRHAPVRVTCLTEALVFARMLHAEGLSAAVRIGVARHEGRLTAHAWVEQSGRILLGAPDRAYAPLTAAAGGGPMRHRAVPRRATAAPGRVRALGVWGPCRGPQHECD